MTRFRIFTLFAALAALTPLLSACGGGGSSDDPQSVVEDATLQGVESGKLDLSLGVGLEGKRSGHIDVDLSGPFQSEAEAQYPEFDLSTSVKGAVGGEKVNFDGGVTLLGGNKAFVEYEGTEYEVDATTFNFVKSLLKQQSAGGESSEATACQDAASGLELDDFVENLKRGGSADVGGTATTKVSGDLAIPGVLDAFSELSEDPACSQQLSGVGAVPSAAELNEARGTIEGSVKTAHVELYVGDDHIVRRLVAQAKIEPPKGAAGGGPKKIEIDLDLSLTGVNEAQAISAPQGSRPLGQLFLKLGINPLELLGAIQSQGGGINGLLEGLNRLGGVARAQGASGQAVQ